MSLISLEQKRDFFEQTRRQAKSVFLGPQASNDLPDAGRYLSMLDGAVLADFDGNTAYIPEDAKQNDNLVVAPVSFGESCHVSSDFFSHTSRQIKTVGRQMSEQLNINPPSESIPANIGETTGAFVGSINSFVPIDKQAGEFLMVRRRPFLIIRMIAGQQLAPAGIIAHELTHAIQQEDNPLVRITSQKSIDMAALRDELEAYHVGALVGRLIGTSKIDKRHAKKIQQFQDIQEAINLMRIAFGVDPLDPYRSSPRLLRFMVDHLERVGCSKSTLLHCELNYEDLVGNLESEESDD